MRDLYGVSDIEDREKLENVCLEAYETLQIMKMKKLKCMEDRLKYSTLVRNADKQLDAVTKQYDTQKEIIFAMEQAHFTKDEVLNGELSKVIFDKKAAAMVELFDKINSVANQ